jgi:hypothetical protein
MADFSKMMSCFQQGRSHPKLNFFQIFKSNYVVQIPKIYQKKLPKKISKDGVDMQDGVWTSFLNKINDSERFIQSIELIFELSFYFSMGNQKS